MEIVFVFAMFCHLVQFSRQYKACKEASGGKYHTGRRNTIRELLMVPVEPAK